ncbi:hydrogenase maturation protease [Streptomyces sp. NPDC048196]|uniref:hydrogenase maturation protease n=1 Tax=Streptomyces sp. NPDC048196 TaxID=3154712 RepID=UPI0033E62947
MSAPAAGAARPPEKTLIAGVGNIFLGDDGFGVEAVRRLGAHPLPDGVEIVDTGVRGVHLAYQMLDGYDTVLLVDATARGAEPGTVHLLDATQPATPRPRAAALDAHHMTPDAVLALLDTLSAGTGGRPPRRVLVVGCEPADIAEGIGLSDPVEAAVDEAVDLILRLVAADAHTEAEAEAEADADVDVDGETDADAETEAETEADTTERSTTRC